MAQNDSSLLQLIPAADTQATQPSLWRRWFGPGTEDAEDFQSSRKLEPESESLGEVANPDLIRKISRTVVPGLPRAQTFQRQQAEARTNLEPVHPTPAEKRALSLDRRLHSSAARSGHSSNPRSSAPDFTGHNVFSSIVLVPSMACSALEEKMLDSPGELTVPDITPIALPEHNTASLDDSASMTTSQYDRVIHEELERIWILNLSMYFRDKSKREKFFVTYRENERNWRRVTVSLDYRGAPEDSLETDLLYTKFQRDKNAKIYEAIRESLVDIQFYDTVTNLKLQTTDGRLHVHVVEDTNVRTSRCVNVAVIDYIVKEIILYPTVHVTKHLGCRHVREKDIDFEAHMSGFVYKVKVNGFILIKKEIPGPDTVDEFLYEVNALSQLSDSHHVIRLFGVIVDDYGEHVKGLLINYAEQGALIDVIYDHNHGLPWARREKWACQIVQGLADIHEAGYVQGDFTLSNIVVDQHDDAKIIDINRRGCPVGWEPPEATPLIECNQRITMYIGVKSDLYQLGMVLWALAEQDDEPETQGRPLALTNDPNVPDWYRTVVRICLAEDPRDRRQAIDLLRLLTPRKRLRDESERAEQPFISVDDGHAIQEFVVSDYRTDDGSCKKAVQAPPPWNKSRESGHTHFNSSMETASEPYYYTPRGRSPPSPLPDEEGCSEPQWDYQDRLWTHQRDQSSESTRSSSVFDLAPDMIVPENGLCDLVPQIQDDDHREALETAEGASLERPVAEDNFASPKQETEAANSLGPVKRHTPSTCPQPCREPQPRSLFEKRLECTKRNLEEAYDTLPVQHQQKPTSSDFRAEDICSLGAEDTASRAISAGRNGVGGSDFLSFPNSPSSNDIASNSLFQEAGTTEPGGLGKSSPIALVSNAAEIQIETDANAATDTQQVGICDGKDQARQRDRIDSARERNSPVTWLGRQQRGLTGPCSAISLGPMTRYPDELLGLGTGHEGEEMQGRIGRRDESQAALSDDNLVET